MHITVGMFCDRDFFGKFGKGGSDSDLLIRNQSDTSGTFTFVYPLSERVQPVLQAAAMADYPIIVINEITPEIGEILILLNEMHFTKGLIVTDFLEDQIKGMIKDMTIAGFEFVKKDEQVVWEKIRNVTPERSKEPKLVTIDTFFDVKGVGVVILGLVKSGTVKQYDKLMCYPAKKEILVKSMQSQDKDIKETEPGHRIGIALKGMEVSEMRRGFVLSDREIRCADRLFITFQKSMFSKYEMAEGKQIMIALGQQVVSGVIKSAGGKMEIDLERNIALYQKVCVLATNDKMPRIIGSGRIL